MNISSPPLHAMSPSSPQVPPTTTWRLPAPESKETDNTKGCDVGHSAGRSNRLTQALTAALRGIGIGSAPSKPSAPATTDTTDTAAASAATASSQGDVNAAVEQFAHALMNALGAGRGERGRGGERRQDGEHGHHGHGARNGRYGDLARRLESLSKTVVEAPPTAQAPETPATAVAPVTAAPISLAPTVEGDASGAAPGRRPRRWPVQPNRRCSTPSPNSLMP